MFDCSRLYYIFNILSQVLSACACYGVCTLQWPYMDVTMAIFHVFLKYKKINKIRSIEIIKKGCTYQIYHNQPSINEKIKSKSWIANK